MSRVSASLVDSGTLRLPVPFFDLFMVLLICFMLFLAPLPEPASDTRAIAVPLATAGTKADPAKLLAVLPQRAGEIWQFEAISTKRHLSATELAAEARTSGRQVVLVLAADTPLQAYVDMQAGLSALGLDYAIAVRNGENR